MSFFWLHFPTCIIPYNLSYFFLINVIPFILVLFLFTIIQILIDFFRRIIFLVLKASKKNVLKFTEHFFS